MPFRRTSSAPVIFLFLLTLISALPARAQRVEDLRGDKVQIALDGLRFVNGQRWEAIDGTGEVLGWIEITQVNASKAYGVIRNGSAVMGANLRLKEDVRITTPDEDIRHRKWFIGPSLMTSDIMTTTNDIEVKLSGSQIGLQLGLDQVLSHRQILRLRLGNDLISAKGATDDPNICGGDQDCKLWTHYLAASLGFVFQVLPEGHSWNAGLSTGFAGLLPVSRESDILDTSKISIDGGFEAGLFANVKTDPITWIEFSAQQLFLRQTTTSRYSLIRYNVNWVQNF